MHRRKKIKAIVSRETTLLLDSLATAYKNKPNLESIVEIERILYPFIFFWPSKLKPKDKAQAIEELHLTLLKKWKPKKASYARFFQKFGKVYFDRISSHYLAPREALQEQVLKEPSRNDCYDTYDSPIFSTRLSYFERQIAINWVLNDFTQAELSDMFNLSRRQLREKINLISQILTQEYLCV